MSKRLDEFAIVVGITSTLVDIGCRLADRKKEKAMKTRVEELEANVARLKGRRRVR